MGLQTGDEGGGGGQIQGTTHLGAPFSLSCSLSSSLSPNALSSLSSNPSFMAEMLWLADMATVMVVVDDDGGGAVLLSLSLNPLLLLLSLLSLNPLLLLLLLLLLLVLLLLLSGGGGSGGTGGRMVVVGEKCTCGIVWSCIARFGRHAPGGHK